ncbi:MAG: hypothetical protein IH986_08195 [Planctomycetes bacterium]|nr:hypothetical protein [Planctomycetota bacterium]
MSLNGKVITLSALEGRIEEVRQKLDACVERITDLQRERTILGGELRGLIGARDLSVDSDSPVTTNGAKPKPKAAIVAYLRNHPGVTSSDVVNALIDQVDTKASDVRRNLHTTLYDLRQEGRVIRTGKKLRVPG